MNMRLTTSDLRNNRQWRATTGLSEEQYHNLLSLFTESYYTLYGQPLSERLQKTGVKFCIQSESHLLFYTLFSLKSGSTYDLLGVTFGMDGSNAKRQQLCGIEVLEHALKAGGHMPVSVFLNEDEIERFFLSLKKCLST